MNAYEIPGLRYSLPAGSNVARHRFVSVNDKSEGVQATASTPVIGVSMNQTKAGEVLEIADGIVMVEAAAPITSGKGVAPDADGKAVSSDSSPIGVTITGTAVAGGLVAVKIN